MKITLALGFLVLATSSALAAFAIFQINTPAAVNQFLLLETGDFLLLETGDKLIL